MYFKTIYNHLLLKLNKLAIIYASKKIFDGVTHFRYYKICIYNFNNFLYLLNNDIIKVSLISRISKSGDDVRRYRNKNLFLMIRKQDIDKLFGLVYSYDYDNNFLNTY